MKQRYFIFDTGLCFGCYGCVAACVNANQTPASLFWRNLHKLPPEDGRHDTRYLSVACNHCAGAPCVKACPAKALTKREEDGVVIHHEERCIGCRLCRMACPFDAIRWDERAGVVSKCHFCHERLAEGRDPACVETCFAGALTQRVVDEPEVLESYAKEAPGLTAPDDVVPHIRFIHREMEKKPGRLEPFPPPVLPAGADPLEHEEEGNGS